MTEQGNLSQMQVNLSYVALPPQYYSVVGRPLEAPKWHFEESTGERPI